MGIVRYKLLCYQMEAGFIIPSCALLMSWSNNDKPEKGGEGDNVPVVRGENAEETIVGSHLAGRPQGFFFSTPNYTCSSSYTSPSMITHRHKGVQINRSSVLRPPLFLWGKKKKSCLCICIDMN